MNKKLLIALSLICLIILGTSFETLAMEVSWPPSPLGTTLDDASTLTILVKYVYEWGIFLGGLAVLISLVFGGFLYLTSAGNPSRLSEAKDRIFSALIGLVLLFSIFLILNTINPELTFLIEPGAEIGSPCDINTDCPTGFTCLNDPNPGDGNKQGYCMFDIASGCNSDADCSATSKCLHDPDSTNGIKEGMCFPTCQEVTFYDDINFTGTATPLSVVNCKDWSGGQTVKSIKMTGSCGVTLYQETTDCNALDATKLNYTVGGSVNNIADFGITTDPPTFQSVKIKEVSF
jgi:hypothetical protein